MVTERGNGISSSVSSHINVMLGLKICLGSNSSECGYSENPIPIEATSVFGCILLMHSKVEKEKAVLSEAEFQGEVAVSSDSTDLTTLKNHFTKTPAQQIFTLLKLTLYFRLQLM